LGDSVKTAMAVVLTSRFVISIFLAAGQQTVMNSIEKLQIITNFTAFNLSFPANAKIFLGCLLQIAQMSLIDTDNFFDEILQLDVTEPLSDNWGDLSYKSLYSMRNFGLPLTAFLMLPLFMGLMMILANYIKHTWIRLIIGKFHNFFICNALVLWLYEFYIFLAASFCMNTFYFKWDTYGNIANSLFTIVSAWICLIFPIFVGYFYS
jgi:hypothetical protein